MSADRGKHRLDLVLIEGEGLGAMDWSDRGLCATEAHSDDFLIAISDMGRRPRWWHDRKAIAVCQRCPVLEECGTYADENDERFGIWGGRRRG